MRYVEYEVGYYKESMTKASDEDRLAKVIWLYEENVMKSSAKYIPEMWSHYVATLQEETTASVEQIRSVYERACRFLGNGFNSESLWLEYSKFEEKLGAQGKLNKVEEMKNEIFTSMVLSMIEKEYAITQFYFHPQTVAVEDQTEWVSCLQRIEKAHEKRMVDFSAVEHLYERCLVPCAHVEDIWMMYANWMVKQASVMNAENVNSKNDPEVFPDGPSNGDAQKHQIYKEKALKIYDRAYTILAGRSASIGFTYVEVLEENGMFEEARSILKEILALKGQKGDLQAIVKFANFERRRNNLTESIRILLDAIPDALSSSDVIFLTIRAANLSLQNNSSSNSELTAKTSPLEAGRKIFESSISEYSKLGMLWQAYAQYEYDNRHL